MENSSLRNLLIELHEKMNATIVIVPERFCSALEEDEAIRRRVIHVGKEGALSYPGMNLALSVINSKALDVLSLEDKEEFMSWLVGREGAKEFMRALPIPQMPQAQLRAKIKVRPPATKKRGKKGGRK